jgi:heme exporter protein A
MPDTGLSPPFTRVNVRDISKVYGPTRALGGVSLMLEAGTVTSIEGPNGVGKSTLLAILATLAKPTRGEVLYGEYDPRDDLDIIRPAIGLVAHEAMVYPDLSARETLNLMAKLYGIGNPRAAVDAMLEQSALAEFANRPARTLSRGQLQRLALARAQLHDPVCLLFDEPTTGLDLASTERVAAAIDAARARGKIVALVTHDRALAERVADVRVFLARGRVSETVTRKPAAGSAAE